MKKTLYLMRHGQTLFNQRKKIQGACDSPLTEIGVKQAKIAKGALADIQIDHAYGSTQERATDTLEIVTHLPYERVKGIKEWNFGVFEGESEDLNPPIDPTQRSYGDFFKQYGGETMLEVQTRMHAALTNIMRKEHHQHVLAVSHGGAIYAFLLKLLRREDETVHIFNCAILVFEFDDIDASFSLKEVINHDFSVLEEA